MDSTHKTVTPADLAASLGISRAAAELTLEADFLDLHVDAFIWHRLAGYDLRKEHGTGVFGARFYGHADVPRLLRGGLTGATWIVSTNPFRTAAGRERTLRKNLPALRAHLEADPRIRVVRTAADYHAARADGRFACFLGIQGGNALGTNAAALDALTPLEVLRVTLVHLTNSNLGATSSPARGPGDAGLSPFGHDVVHALEAARVFVDLAHASRKTFFDVVETHDRTKPLLVTHTGVAGVYPHWRNLDDAQLRAIAESGGVIGVMLHVDFLGPRARVVSVETVVDHLEHIVQAVGEDHAALGSDWDGAIVTPRDMPTAVESPRLVDAMLRRGWSDTRIRKILGGNVLRAVAAMRG
ncbi:MAG: membrane dipeptidase [Myxococcales bacterium]|nr:membrane dipeptidase [Myxococcales bacterium]